MTRRPAIARLAATVALTMLGCLPARTESFQGRCAGILHRDNRGIWFGGEKSEGESICIVARSQVAKVLKVCTSGRYCVVVGKTGECKDSGECTEIKYVVSVAAGKAPRRR